MIREVKTAIRDVVERIADGAHVVWRDERQPFVADGVIVKLHARSFKSAAAPEARERFDATKPDGQQIRTDLFDQKTFTLSILVESFDTVDTANELLEKIKTRLWRPWALERLRDVNVAVLSADASADLPTSYDQRVWSACSVDIRMGLGVVDDQDDFDATAADESETDANEYIETVILNEGLENEQTIHLTTE